MEQPIAEYPLPDQSAGHVPVRAVRARKTFILSAISATINLLPLAASFLLWCGWDGPIRLVFGVFAGLGCLVVPIVCVLPFVCLIACVYCAEQNVKARKDFLPWAWTLSVASLFGMVLLWLVWNQPRRHLPPGPAF
jgi:hypothetical protein